MMKRKDRERTRTMRKAAAFALAVVFLLSACGMAKSENSGSQSAYSTEESGENSYNMKEESYGYQAAAEESVEAQAAMDYAADADGADAGYARETGSAAAQSENGADDGGQTDLQSANRKIVYTGNVSLQTLEYDDSAQSIHDKITKYGGFIESENTSNEDPYWYYRERTGSSARRVRRNLSITARIPAEKFDAFMKDLENDGQVINTSINAQNISVSYANHDASRKALEIEQDRLLKMMEKAETIEEMIAVEERLTQVERELGNEKTTLSAMDRDVNFSTVNINLEEVFEYSETVVETTYGERLKRAFGNAIAGFVEFWGDVVLFIVGTFPFLIMLAVILFAAVKLVRRANRRRAERKAAWRASGGAAASGKADGAADAGSRWRFRKRPQTPAGPEPQDSPAQPDGQEVRTDSPAQPENSDQESKH